jgi:DNA recombination protein RmuC
MSFGELPTWWPLAAGAAGGVLLGLTLGWLASLPARRRLAAADAELKSQQRLEAEREQALKMATEQLGQTFSRLAHEQFQSHSETFLKLAKENLGTHHERAKGELAAREQAIESLVRPIREAIQRTEAQLQELDKARRETHGSIKAQLEAMATGQQALSAETRNLVNALRRPEVRGQWGELTLKRLVELAGMVEHCDFVTQSQQDSESGVVRPDMIVRLPESRQLVVDVKTPLDAYLEATEAATEAERRNAYTRHAAILADRVRELAAKAYWAQFEQSPEFVILFIPGDQFLSAALAQRPNLLDDALRQNIILATPTSLVALLKAVAYGWRQVALTENAVEIRRLAVQLYERLGSFTSHLAQVGKTLNDSVRAYNRSVGSLERMVLPSARRFTELGVKPRSELAAPKVIDDTPRAVQPRDGDTQSPPDAETGASGETDETDRAASEPARRAEQTSGP